MKKNLYAVQLNGTFERVLASDIYNAITEAKKLSNKKRSVCDSVEFLYTVFFTSKLKPHNQVFKVTIDHKTLNMERSVYMVIARGVTFAAKLAMKIHLANTELDQSEKKGLYVESCESDHVVYI